MQTDDLTVGTDDSNAELQETQTSASASASASTTSTSRRSISKDEGFHLLQNSRRRAVLRYLLAHPDHDQFAMRDVAEAVAAWEHDTTVRQLMSDERQRVYIALYQSHLPKLDKNGIIEYDQSRGVVEPTPLLEAFDPYLDDGLETDTDEFLAPDRTSDDDRESEGVAHRIADLFGN